MARAHVRRTNKKSGSLTGPGVTVFGLDDLITRLTTVEKKLQNPKKALENIVKEFAFMEAVRFRNSGMAPEFGITKPWVPVAEATIRWRDGSPIPRPLVNFGFLESAATHPVVTPFGKKSVSLSIDPRRFTQDSEYTKNNNYGNFHQVGMGVNQKREFVTLTPAFSIIAKKIIQAYLDDEISGNGYRSYRSIGTPGGIGRHTRSHKPQPYIKRASRAQDPELTRIRRSEASKRAAQTRIANQRAQAERERAIIADRKATAREYGWNTDEQGMRTTRKSYGEYLYSKGHRNLSPNLYENQLHDTVNALKYIQGSPGMTAMKRAQVLKQRGVTEEMIQFHRTNYQKYIQGADGFAD